MLAVELEKRGAGRGFAQLRGLNPLYNFNLSSSLAGLQLLKALLGNARRSAKIDISSNMADVATACI